MAENGLNLSLPPAPTNVGILEAPSSLYRTITIGQESIGYYHGSSGPRHIGLILVNKPYDNHVISLRLHDTTSQPLTKVHYTRQSDFPFNMFLNYQRHKNTDPVVGLNLFIDLLRQAKQKCSKLPLPIAAVNLLGAVIKRINTNSPVAFQNRTPVKNHNGESLGCLETAFYPTNIISGGLPNHTYVNTLLEVNVRPNVPYIQDENGLLPDANINSLRRQTIINTLMGQTMQLAMELR